MTLIDLLHPPLSHCVLQVTSCTPHYPWCGELGGCLGSSQVFGFNYLQLYGHVREEDWPYTSGTDI